MRVGIVAAMDKEALPFLRNKNAATEKVGQFTVYKMKIGNNEIFLCRQAYVGEICAAAATQLLLARYGAETIINFGVVGGLTERVSLLSTVIVGSVVHYGMDISYDGYEVGRYTCFDETAVSTDKELLEKAKKLLDLPVVRCASADRFVDGKEAKTALNRQFDADICDMESAGILITCKMNGIPCLILKAVSDSLTGGGEEFSVNVAKASEAFLEFVETFLNYL